ncbi:hypothetical protein PsW64_02841 [Pseudovibrio sp. W64]|uniref:DUF192 domain-containing protein n=1 Tax=unclassified Pseudovibrio TaxID=2627060 RepID=UPI0007B3156E|nr:MULTISPECIES: DUF192 domain-containing protein [unclassified Pseudovibrio]KZK80277.1 hypothetical protein PsW64_02841 [Pseudovibrio sp. W64]KZK83190.1 hypothetical protein PsAD13_03395 [Pseudovibrio sp. Ad13]
MTVLRIAFIFVLLGMTSTVAAGMRTEILEVRSVNGTHEFQVQVAETPDDRAQGLMGRTDLTADQGMLFIFPQSGLQYFWMKNTPTSLDIIFIGSDYKVKSIAANTVPYSEEIIPSGLPAQYVLEVVAGRAAELGIQPGDRVIRIP